MLFFVKTGLWIAGHKCTTGAQEYFSNYNDMFNKADWYYTLDEAKEECSLGCDASEDCHYADLYYRRFNYRGEVNYIKQRCHLYYHNCGEKWELNADEDMHLYHKGSYMVFRSCKHFCFSLGSYPQIKSMIKL